MPNAENLIVYQGTKENIIGRGNFGLVFRGTFNDEEVAVKRVQLVEVIEREEETFRQLGQHENIVQLLYAENQGEFR